MKYIIDELNATNQLNDDNIRNHNIGLTHILYENKDVAEKVSLTDKWVNEKIIDIVIEMNGVKVPAGVLEEVLHSWHESIEKHYIDKYSDLNAEVDKRTAQRVSNIVREKIDPFVNKLKLAADILDNVKYIYSASDWENLDNG